MLQWQQADPHGCDRFLTGRPGTFEAPAKTEDRMAGGWAKDGAVSDQIEASISDELQRMKARRNPSGDSLRHCAECDEPIPKARRAAIPGVKLCVDCAAEPSCGV